MKHILKNTLAVLDKKEKKQFLFLILLDVFISVIDILSLILLLWIVRFYIQPSATYISFLPGWLADNSSVSFIAVFLLLFGLKNLFGFFIARAQFNFISRIAIRISANNLTNYQHSPYSEFVDIDSSAHLRTIAFQPFDFAQYMLSGLQQIITQLSLILFAIIAIICFDAKLFLLLLLVLLPPVVIVFYTLKKKFSVAKKNIISSNEKSFQYLLDALKGFVESNIYNRNRFFLQRFIHSRRQFSKWLFDSLSLQNMPSRIIEIFAVMGLFILIVIAKWTGNNDSNALITVGAFMAAAYRIIPGIVKVINISSQMKAYEFSMDHLEKSKTVDDPIRETKAVDTVASVEFNNISFRYKDQPVLNNFSFIIKKGDFVGITGQSGKGKTTILNLLLGFLKPASGEILINGSGKNDIDLKNYWPLVTYVRQQNFFIHDTLLKNITLEDDKYNNDNLQQALNISGLDQLLQKFPEGLEKIITENGKNISGGQQQRVAIARALYKNAEIILLDEPFNELDDESTHSLLTHFQKLSAAGKTIVMITHDKKSLSFCNKVISLDEPKG